MYEFLDRLISLALPRVRDFRGLNPNAFDGNGNYSLGLNEQLVFPELNPDKYTRVQGMNITICSSRALERRIARNVARPSACRSAAKMQKRKQAVAAAVPSRHNDWLPELTANS